MAKKTLLPKKQIVKKEVTQETPKTKIVIHETENSTKVNPKKIAEERKSLLESITSDLEEQGVPNICPVEQGGVLNIDSDYLILPKDLTDIPSRLLGNYLNSYTQNRMYMRTLIGWQELHLEGAKRRYFDKFVPVYEELCKQKLSETAKELMANNHEDVKDLFLDFKDEKQKLKMLGYSLASIEDAIFLISREISRRGADFNMDNRNENVQRR